MAKKKETIEIQTPAKELNEVKQEVLDYAKERIDVEIQNSIKKLEKKIYKKRTFTLLKRNLFIILLLVIIGYLMYELYHTGYFNQFIVPVEIEKQMNEEKESTILETPAEDQLTEQKDALIKRHQNAFKNFIISENSSSIADLYNGNLSEDVKITFAMNQFDKTKFTEEEDMLLLNEIDLNALFEELFNTSFEHKTFTFNGESYRYLKSQQMYLVASYKKEKSNIQREIVDVKEDGDNVIITTVEAIVDKDKVSNILTKKEVAEYKDKKSIISNKEKLNQLVYTFEVEDGHYHLKTVNTVTNS